MILKFEKDKTYIIDYTNWKNERRLRRVIYVDTMYGVCPYHKETPDVYLVVAIKHRGSAMVRLRFFDTTRIHSVSRDMSEYARPEENPLS